MSLLRLGELKIFAEKKGGKCLSESYSCNKKPLLWQCALGHTWEASADKVKNRGQWCAHCAGNARLTIEELQKIAKEKEGKCLSESYHNSQTGMKWQCSKDHIWIGTANNVKRGKWCKICSLKRAGLTRRCTIQEMQQVAQEHGGLCLSIEYRGDKQKLEWQCA